jgi:LPS sulfotransferase NodH
MEQQRTEHYDLATARHDYPRWEGPPRRSIVICTHPRSGSTLLGEAMTFAGGMGCPLEYFHAGFRPTLTTEWQAEPIADYAREAHARRTDPGGTFAVKLFWRDVVELANELDPVSFPDHSFPAPGETPAETYRALARLLAPLIPAPAFVHLERRDRIRQAVSGLAATDTGLWRSIPGVGLAEPKAEPLFDYDRIDRMIGYSDFCHGHWRNFFAALGEVPHALTYEELAEDYTGTLAALFAHLGSDAEAPQPRMRRQADSRNEAFVLRYLQQRMARG